MCFPLPATSITHGAAERSNREGKTRDFMNQNLLDNAFHILFLIFFTFSQERVHGPYFTDLNPGHGEDKQMLKAAW